MAGLRVRRTWWIAQRIAPEAPLFRQLSQRWRPVDRRERRLTPFVLLLSTNPAKPSRVKSAPSRIALIAEQMRKKSARTWNAWLHVK
jgi:hypothetical protein